jgi:hypothetical protein
MLFVSSKTSPKSIKVWESTFDWGWHMRKKKSKIWRKIWRKNRIGGMNPCEGLKVPFRSVLILAEDVDDLFCYLISFVGRDVTRFIIVWCGKEPLRRINKNWMNACHKRRKKKEKVCLSEIFHCKLLVFVSTTDCISVSVFHSVSKVEFALNNLERLIVAVGVCYGHEETKYLEGDYILK